jgi:hypothetical protein
LVRFVEAVLNPVLPHVKKNLNYFFSFPQHGFDSCAITESRYLGRPPFFPFALAAAALDSEVIDPPFRQKNQTVA